MLDLKGGIFKPVLNGTIYDLIGVCSDLSDLSELPYYHRICPWADPDFSSLEGKIAAFSKNIKHPFTSCSIFLCCFPTNGNLGESGFIFHIGKCQEKKTEPLQSILTIFQHQICGTCISSRKQPESICNGFCFQIGNYFVNFYLFFVHYALLHIRYSVTSHKTSAIESGINSYKFIYLSGFS